MTNSPETTVQQTCDVVGLGAVFCYSDDETMSVPALLQYLRGLRRAGKSNAVVELALAEAKVLHEGNNEKVEFEDFAYAVGRRLLYTLE